FLVRARPVGAQSFVARRPRLGLVRGLEETDSLHDRPEPGWLLVVEHQRRDAEMTGRLVRRVVPHLAPRLARKRGEQRPRFPLVMALEDPRRLDADEHAAVLDGERRDLRKLYA